MQLQEKSLFANRYELIKLLGRGGFSEVWLAKDNWTHLRIALKVYAPGQGMDTNGLQEFCGELASVYDLNHSNLLKPQHVDTWENMPYLIMAYCSNGSCARKVGQMSEDDMWKFIHDVALGLMYLHSRDVVHQDIKPDNILIDDAGNYLITDFGVSTRARSTLRKSVVSSAAGGTTAYMGPERFSRQPAPTKASDIWSFGAMCFELLEGVVPFGEIGGGMQKGGAEVPVIQADVSAALKFVITKMLQKETWDRPIASQLVEWSKNSASILVDNALIAAEPDHAPISPASQGVSRKTQRFAPSQPVEIPKTVLTNNEPQVRSNKKYWMKRIIGIIIVVVVSVFGIVKFSKIQAEKKQVHTNHNYYVTQFDSSIEEASIDNVAALEIAYKNLNGIHQCENHPRFSGHHEYNNRCTRLSNKAGELYNIIDGKYQRAPAGSNIERALLEKRKKIQDLRNKL